MHRTTQDDFLLPQGLNSLAAQVLLMARERGLRLASAESCTGGRIGAALTAIPGSSDCYQGGVIAYQNAVKEKLLGVSGALLSEHGAVSEPVARAMAQGARKALEADWAVSTSGIAGPGGGSETKPVGLVCMGIAGPRGDYAYRHIFSGTREEIQSQSVYTVLELLLRHLQET